MHHKHSIPTNTGKRLAKNRDIKKYKELKADIQRLI